MYCHNCGSENADSASFCHNCGTGLVSVKTHSPNSLKNMKNGNIDNNEGIGSVINIINSKKKIVVVIILVLLLIFVLPTIISKSHNEVPEQQIESFINDEYYNYEIENIEHNYDSDMHIDTVVVEVVFEDEYADVYRELTLEYFYSTSDDYWSFQDYDDRYIDTVWNDNILKIWSGDGYSFEVHSIDSSDYNNTKITCSYRFNGSTEYVLGDQSYVISGSNEICEVARLTGTGVITKSDETGETHNIYVTLSTSSGIKIQML